MKKKILVIMILFIQIILLNNCCGMDDYDDYDSYKQCQKDSEAVLDLIDGILTVVDSIDDDSGDSNSASSDEEPLPAPIITQVTNTTTSITIDLAAANTAPLADIQTKIFLRKGGFCGPNVDFVINEITSTQYTLTGFILGGETHILTIQKDSFLTVNGGSQAVTEDF